MNIRLFDRLGHFVTRTTAAGLARAVAEHGLDEGWMLADGADFWRPLPAFSIEKAG